MWVPKHLSTIQKEERRLVAAALLKEGKLSQAQIAAALGVSRQIVNRWARQLRSDGPNALRSRARRGRPAYLTATQWEQVLTLLQAGAQAFGFTTDAWTLDRIAKVIQQQFDVRYNAHYVGERLHALGWSAQVPEVAPRERDEDLVRAWLRGDWPRLLKKHVNWEHKSPFSMR